jgi:hypothetical protein
MPHASWRDARQAPPRAVLGRIVRDDTAHGVVRWTFLDWAEPLSSKQARTVLASHGDFSVQEILKPWTQLERRSRTMPQRSNGIGWIGDERYLARAARALAERVIRPLRDRGISRRVRTVFRPGARASWRRCLSGSG